jgi:hypothetical protein
LNDWASIEAMLSTAVAASIANLCILPKIIVKFFPERAFYIAGCDID